jgi:hypothetical protein
LPADEAAQIVPIDEVGQSGNTRRRCACETGGADPDPFEYAHEIESVRVGSAARTGAGFAESCDPALRAKPKCDRRWFALHTRKMAPVSVKPVAVNKSAAI